MTDTFTFGLEEEYFLVDAQTRQIARRPEDAFFTAAEAATAGRISREFLQAQIEVISSPHVSTAPRFWESPCPSPKRSWRGSERGRPAWATGSSFG